VSRTLSAQAVLSLNSLSTGAAWFVLVHIQHPELDTPHRFVNNTTDVVALGHTWVGYPFDLTLAVDDGQTNPSVEVRFDNVNRALIEVIRGLPSAPTLDVYVVLSTQPNVIEMSLLDMTIMDITYDMQSISGRLISGDLLNAPWPADSYDPSQFPSVFA
jgi:hypothetical protein